MLLLLLKTRIRYYRNYIRYHFDRRTKIEILVIFLVLVLMTLRSPADMGYNFKWMHDEKFVHHWFKIFTIIIPFFYILCESFAIVTLRNSSEWSILGGLPFSRKEIARYYLARYLSKTVLFISIGCLPFLLALTIRFEWRILHFFVALGILLFLQFLAFEQGHRCRNIHKSFWHRALLWGVPEISILGLLVMIGRWLGNVFLTSNKITLMGLLLLWPVLPIFLKFIEGSFALRDGESPTIALVTPFTNNASATSVRLMRGFYRSFIVLDMLFLWRQKRSTWLIPLSGIVIAIVISITGDDMDTTCVILLFFEVIYSILLLGAVMTLFEKDVPIFEFMRSLSVKVTSIWRARWFVIAGLIGVTMVVPIIIMMFRSGIDLKFILFVMGTSIVIPSIIATLFCNSGFGLFPYTNLSGLVTGISIILMVLFWFFMPFGTLIIFVVMIFWIRKSQRHFQYLELL